MCFCGRDDDAVDDKVPLLPEPVYSLQCFGCRQKCQTRHVYYNSHAGMFGLCESCFHDLNHFDLTTC